MLPSAFWMTSQTGSTRPPTSAIFFQRACAEPCCPSQGAATGVSATI